MRTNLNKSKSSPKTLQRILPLLVLLPLCGYASPTNELAHPFGIYLTTGTLDPRLKSYGTGDWSNLELLSEPIISGKGIASYDWETHTITLKPEALHHPLPHAPVDGLPFVVVADGKKIYAGLFTTTLSSMSFAIPCITVETSDSQKLTINRGYPTAEFGRGQDPRNDPRIKVALAGLGILNKPVEPPAQVSRTFASTRFATLTVTTNDVIRVEKPGVGAAEVRFVEFGDKTARYRWQFTSRVSSDTSSGEGAVDEITPGNTLVKAGDTRRDWSHISFEWSYGGPEKGYIYYDPAREKVELGNADAK